MEIGNEMVTPEQLRHVAHRQGAGAGGTSLHIGPIGRQTSGAGVRGDAGRVQGGGGVSGVDDAMVERLAKFIYRKESANLSLDESLRHQSNWRRAIPEAREMLEAAFNESGAAE